MRSLLWSVVLAMVLTAVAIVSRPLLPVDETRYVSVAWEAHQRGDYLVSHLNNQPYSHKPPLLFWLINAVWSVTGVSSLAARLVAPAAGVACLPLTWLMVRRLWPDNSLAAGIAPLVHATMILWMFFSPLTMFDTLLTCFAMIALLGILRAEQGFAISGWCLAGTALGFGLLSKGPVVLVHVLPAALLGPWWSASVRSRPGSWYLGCFSAVIAAAGIALSWAIPSALAGGDVYAGELLFGQTAGRMVSSFAHRQPMWWYLPWLPSCLMPWIFVGSVWRGGRCVSPDRGLKFLLSWALGSLVILSFVSGKQIYYLLPMIPACAMIIARLTAAAETAPTRWDVSLCALGTIGMSALPLILNHVPGLTKTQLSGLLPDWSALPLMSCGVIQFSLRFRRTKPAVLTIATTAAAFVAVLTLSLSANLWNGFDLQPLATFAAGSERPVAWFGNYHGQLNFAGAIPEVRELLTEEEMRTWHDSYPNGAIVIRLRAEDPQCSDVMPTLKDLDRVQLNREQQQLLSSVLCRLENFPLRDLGPQVMFVQWLRRGLTMDPCVVVTYNSPVAADAQMAEGQMADLRQVRLQWADLSQVRPVPVQPSVARR